ncbi:PREDICTED: atrial natriuretic peptide receptor 2-like [Branchiostoma belcheri]|uniref:guanylate cyclase n=1 Tax=Branchiostoma belcheri TaxID=7741 RepID=A0A6P4XE17_BRABE|nr:PREDICTED: atrial natriuretic peptide receptor 2-like [Branchiostoma belcheri]
MECSEEFGLGLELLRGAGTSTWWEALGQNRPVTPSFNQSVTWYDNITEFVQDLHSCQTYLSDFTTAEVSDQMTHLYRTLALQTSLSVVVVLCFFGVVSLVHKMIVWVKNFAAMLEQRTEELRKEKKLTDRLLHEMLPPIIADQLKKRQPVEAESYDQVTVFFSDIVGFTNIAASCTPMQVVEILNSLYVCFDIRIQLYDVYKVETIGDGYMVASGVPERNGDRHAEQIAIMALDLLVAIDEVTIPHSPNKRLRLRIGIHTGPAVAAVVGVKMPRYCLFGDTVNTASRMESSSLPQKIQVSNETHTALRKKDCFMLQARGDVDIKGKGKMKTYWLIGHKNHREMDVETSLVCSHQRSTRFLAKEYSLDKQRHSVPNLHDHFEPLFYSDSDPMSSPGKSSCRGENTLRAPYNNFITRNGKVWPS